LHRTEFEHPKDGSEVLIREGKAPKWAQWMNGHDETITRRSDEPKLKVGDKIPIKEGVVVGSSCLGTPRT